MFESPSIIIDSKVSSITSTAANVSISGSGVLTPGDGSQYSNSATPQSLATKDAEIIELNKKIRNLQSLLTNAQEAHEATQAEWMTEIKKTRALHSLSESTVQSLRIDKTELTNTCEALKREVADKTVLYDNVIEKNHELTRQLEESKALLLSKDQTLQQLQGQLAESSRAMEELKQKNKSMEKEVHEVTSRLREAERQLAGKAQLESELSAQLEELQSEKEIWTLKSN